MCNSRERLATRENGLSNSREGLDLQSERTDCLIRGNGLQSERTSCPIRLNELLIRECTIRYYDLLMAFFENPHVPSGLT